MAKSKASKLQSLIAQIENLFKSFEDGFSDKDLEVREKSLGILKKQVGKVQAKADKGFKAQRESSSVDIFDGRSSDQVGDMDLWDSIQMGKMG
ncbi:hypothetical protein [Marispirochaeta sp.]|uniref:hypothetical protein n=1 Tax=Marispirochaeta sp. TaxID=2038653 RepID=UPI0029C8E07A|nr:hypothetical protein [Marispirochaeta sp.]